MRLGQLSRKLSVRPAEIVAFLASTGTVIEDSANARIDDGHAKAVIAHFNPEMKFDEAIPDDRMEDKTEIPTPQLQELMPVEVQPKSTTEKTDANEAEVNSGQIEGEVPDGSETVTEVIKATKVELQGLKVVGKIDLPEPKKKESPPLEENADGEEKSEKSARRERPESKIHTPNKHATSRPRKNPVVAKRERETREAEERRKADLEREKEKRTQFYLRRVRTAPPSRKINLVDEPLNELKDEAPDEPRTLWGKFVKWLTSH